MDEIDPGGIRPAEFVGFTDWSNALGYDTHSIEGAPLFRNVCVYGRLFALRRHDDRAERRDLERGDELLRLIRTSKRVILRSDWPGTTRGVRSVKRNAVLATGLALLAIACGGPILIIPGGKLAGEAVLEPVTDWSFATDSFVDLETRPENPYSVEINYVVRDGKLYIDPDEGRKWLEHLRADPRARVRLAGKVYPVTAVLMGAPGELPDFDPDAFIYRLDSRRD